MATTLTGPLSDAFDELIQRASGPLAKHVVKPHPAKFQRKQALEATTAAPEEEQESPQDARQAALEQPQDIMNRMRRDIKAEEEWKMSTPHPRWDGPVEGRLAAWKALSREERINLSDSLGPRDDSHSLVG